MITGELDMFASNFDIYLPLLVDEVGGLQLPFMVPTEEATKRYLASPYMEEGWDRDLHLRHIRFLEVDAYRSPSRVIASTKPLASLEAFKGLRLALFPAPNKPDIKVWQGLGVTIVELDRSDLTAAFEQHKIDAVIMGSPSELVAAKIERLAPHTGPISDRPQIWQISIHEPTWQKLTPAQQEIIGKAAQDTAASYRQLQEERYKKAAASLHGFGQDIKIDALAAHQQLSAVYQRQIKVGGMAPKVLESAAMPGASSAAFPVGVGQEFRDCPDCPVMVVVPAGEFMMGSPPNEKGRVDTEGPQHRVVVSHPFAIAKFPTTVGELKLWRPDDDTQSDNERDPAVMLTWFDGVAYAEWLSKKTGQHYHLPTEAEYEYAERGGTKTPYYWGDTIGVGNANCFGCNGKWDGRGTSPVGSFPPNPFGLYDMTGNIFEWQSDCFSDDESTIPEDAFTPRPANSDGSCAARVAKGTSSFNLPSFLRSAYRYGDAPTRKNARKGFRLVRD
jgi:formylglycine-generating enzyme required for sulfatase activity